MEKCRVKDCAGYSVQCLLCYTGFVDKYRHGFEQCNTSINSELLVAIFGSKHMKNIRFDFNEVITMKKYSKPIFRHIYLFYVLTGNNFAKANY